MEKIADRLKMALEIRGMKQADIIERTHINKGALSSYISGRYNPKQDNIYLLAKALNVSEAWLMGADVPMDRDISLKDDVLQPSSLSAKDQILLDAFHNLNEEIIRSMNEDR